MNRSLSLIIAVLIMHNGITFAQNIEITVLNKNSQPMPYAYILVNNKPVEVSDTLGIAIIPLYRLAYNDTISVSYLGASPSKIIYDESLKKSKKHIFYLDEPGYNLNEVIVTYQDIEKLFRKSIKSIPVLNYDCKMNAKFNYKLSYDQTTYPVGINNKEPVSGTLIATNDIRFKPKHWNWFDPPLRYITDSDTNRLTSSLNFNIHSAFFFANFSLYIWEHNIKRAGKPFYSYLGEKDNFKVFRISYPKTFFIGFYYQIILYVDKNTRYIKSVQIEAFNNEPDINNYLYKFSLMYDCELYTHKKPKMNTIYLPVNVHYIYQVVNFSRVEINISDVSVQ
jgi:hypothetical protein